MATLDKNASTMVIKRIIEQLGDYLLDITVYWEDDYCLTGESIEVDSFKELSEIGGLQSSTWSKPKIMVEDKFGNKSCFDLPMIGMSNTKQFTKNMFKELKDIEDKTPFPNNYWGDF